MCSVQSVLPASFWHSALYPASASVQIQHSAAQHSMAAEYSTSPCCTAQHGIALQTTASPLSCTCLLLSCAYSSTRCMTAKSSFCLARRGRCFCRLWLNVSQKNSACCASDCSAVQVAEELRQCTQEHDIMLSERQEYEDRLARVSYYPFLHGICCMSYILQCSCPHKHSRSMHIVAFTKEFVIRYLQSLSGSLQVADEKLDPRFCSEVWIACTPSVVGHVTMP